MAIRSRRSQRPEVIVDLVSEVFLRAEMLIKYWVSDLGCEHHESRVIRFLGMVEIH